MDRELLSRISVTADIVDVFDPIIGRIRLPPSKTEFSRKQVDSLFLYTHSNDSHGGASFGSIWFTRSLLTALRNLFWLWKNALVSKFSIFIWIRTTLWKDISRNNIQFNFGNEKTSAMTRNWANLHFHIVFPRHCYQDLLLFDVIIRVLPYRFYNPLLTRCGL